MKVPHFLFVKHSPDLSPERKVFLSEHLKERVPIKNIIWFEDYNHDHPFIAWVNTKLQLPYGLKLTSNTVRMLLTFKRIIDEKIDCALLIDDDVVFHKNWLEILESIPSEIENNGFINLGTPHFFNVIPQKGNVYRLPNNGGCEGVWVSYDFAVKFMTNLNLHQAADIILHGFMLSQDKPILNIPICHQTSQIEKFTTLDHDTRKTDNWITYINEYKHLPKVNFFALLKEFKQFEERKKQIDDKFYELYGKKVDIKNVNYIVDDDPEYKLNILDF
jgi:hypothetical protein